MADDQAKFDLKIGLQVEGGDSAAQRIAALTKQIGGLERQASQMRGLANIPIQMQDLIKSSYGAAKGLGNAKDQAKALSPAISAIGEAVKKTGLSQDILKSVGLDDKSLRAAGKNADGFRGLIENLAKARSRAISASSEYSGKAESLSAERSLLTTNFNREQRLREEAARKAVATDKATEAQKTQVAMAGARERIAVAKRAATSVSDATSKDLTPRRIRAGGRFNEAELAAQAKRLAPYEAEYRSIKDAQARKAAEAAASKQVTPSAPSANVRGVSSGLEGLASAAKNASSALNALAKSARPAGGRGPTKAQTPELIATRMMREMRGGFAKEYAQLHRMERRNEASVFPKSQYAAGSGGSGGPGSPKAPQQLSSAYGQIDKSAAAAARSISQVRSEGDAITGQIKNVLGMAFGYQAIHAVASQLQQVFGHLQGGVVQFNSMLEQATVGFTTLFDNQRKQAEATNELVGENAVGIDFMAMGYDNAKEAAEGVIETIRQFANVTPFRFAEIQESTLRMRAFGFDMQEILYENSESVDQFSGGIVAVGNAVAALGGGADAFRRITYALGQMKQAGRVYQNDMMQLANAGIGGYKYIAEALMKEITTDGKGTQDKVIKGQENLYRQLQSNAIETVRRLTTSGKISGEVASRAILSGLERDFGGGMMAQSKTFAGAFSTVADMSQSLVADSFRPLYNAIRDITYEFSLFLQDPSVRASALAFSDVVEKILVQLKPMGALLMSIGKRIGKDFANAMSSIGSSVGGVGGTFGAFAIGVREIIKLLENDFARTIVATAALIGVAFKFASANPFMVSIGLLITLLGALKMAVNENLFGIGQAFRQMAASIEPMIGIFRDEFLPVLMSVLLTISQGIIAGLSAAFRALAPTISAVAQVLGTVLSVLSKMEPVLRVIGFLLGVSLASKLVIGGISLLTGALFRATVQMRAFNVAAIAASASMSRLQKLSGAALAVGMVGTMATQGAAQSGAISPEAAASLQGIFDITMAFAVLSMVLPTLIAALKAALVAIGAFIAALPLIGLAFQGAVAAVAAAGVGLAAATAGVALAVIAIIAAIGLLIAFLLGKAGEAEDERRNSELKPGDPGYADRVRSRYYDTRGTVLDGSGYYKDSQYASSTVQNGLIRNDLNQRSMVNFRQAERESRYPRVIEQAKSGMRDLTNYQKLLINQQDAANTALKKYNGLLAIAKQRVADALEILQKVAEEVLDDIINPDFENPYALDSGEMVKYEKLLEIEQEMSFTTFENRQGISRSFDEYKDILDSILPLTEDELNAGEVNLKMVNERLKIEKERRKEQERIKALAEAEYDLGLATLQQYDESIDPLQRAIQLRQAQQKYEKDISDLRFEGLENLVDEATNSRDWGRLTEATKERLEEFSKGQELILDEMTRMFEDYNRDIAWILENPDLSWAEKESQIAVKLKELQGKLEERFGITIDMMGAKVTEMNSAMRSVMDAANMKGIDMNVTFAEDLIKNLETKGFKVLISYIMKKYKEVLRLMQLVARATATVEALADPGNQVKALKKNYETTLNTMLSTMVSKGVASDELKGVRAGIKGLAAINEIAPLQTKYNQILDEFAIIASHYPKLFPRYFDKETGDMVIPGFHSGGIMEKNRLSLVGERGPELVLPQSRGLVLNNSISSRLLGMLAGNGGGNGGSNVTINVNNPVIRNDNDIRKLAQEISRVQASQFRTEGGRL